MKFIDLKSGHLTCRIAPEMGGAIYSFDYSKDGHTQHLMRPAPNEEAHQIVDFASWPLVPYSNRINKGKFEFQGTSYRVPITWLGPPHHASHGQGWEHPWDIVSHDAKHCELRFYFDEPRYWPFPYGAEQRFSLEDNCLNIQLSVVNKGSKPMPAGLGLHPYFPKTETTTLQATVKNLWEIDEHTIPSRRIPIPAKYDFSSPKKLEGLGLDHCFDGYGGKMEIVWENEPVKLQVESSKELSHFVVYTPAGKNFFCAEPVSHMPDAVNRLKENKETGLVVLRPGENLSVDYKFKIAPR